MANPQTLFLTPSNSTVETINNYVTTILFETHPPIAEIINAFKSPMKIYKNMTVIITENRYKFLTNFTCSQSVYTKHEPNIFNSYLDIIFFISHFFTSTTKYYRNNTQ